MLSAATTGAPTSLLSSKSATAPNIRTDMPPSRSPESSPDSSDQDPASTLNPSSVSSSAGRHGLGGAGPLSSSLTRRSSSSLPRRPACPPDPSTQLFVGHRARVWSLDLRTGEPHWRARLRGAPACQPVTICPQPPPAQQPTTSRHPHQGHSSMGRRREASGGTGGVWGLPAPPTLLVTCGPSLRCLEIGSGEMVWENQLRGMGRGEVRMLRGTVPLKQDDGRAIASGGNMAPPSPITPAFSPALGLGLDHGDGQLAGHQPATPASAEPAGYGFEYPTQPQTIDLVFLSVGSRVKAVRAGSGVNVWEAEPVPLKAQAPQQGDAPNQENTQQQFSTVTSLLLQDGALYLGYQCGVVRALDALTGKLIWERNLCSSHAANGGVGAGTDECGETDPTVQGGPRRGSTVSNTGNHIPSPSAQQAPVPLGGHVSLATVRSGDGEHNRSVDGIWGAEGSHC